MLPVVSPDSQCSIDMFLKIKHAILNASLISQCWFSKGHEMTDHFTIEIYGINRIISSTNLAPYSLEYEARRRLLPSIVVKKLSATPY